MVGIYFYPGWDVADTRAIDLETRLSHTTAGTTIVIRPREMNTTGTQTISMDPWGRRSAIIDSWASDFYREYLAPAKNWRWYNKFNSKPEPVVPHMKPCTVKIVRVNKCASIVQRRAQKRKQFMKGLK